MAWPPPPYDEFLGFSGRVGGHSDNQKKGKWIWACMCFIIIECLGRLKVLAVGATISKLTSVFLSLYLSLFLPLSWVAFIRTCVRLRSHLDHYE